MDTMCRDRYGYFPADVFSLWTCSFCYVYLFNSRSGLTVNYNRKTPRLVDRTSLIDYLPDVQNLTARAQICEFLSDVDCGRWVSCCESASACCEEQLSQHNQNVSSDDVKAEGSHCPATWDGISCVEATAAGTTADVPCSSSFFSILDSTIITGMGSKECRENGTWFQHPYMHQEWTNYTTCFQRR